MASSPITSWPMDGKKVKAVTDFLFLGSKIISMLSAAMKLKRCFLLGRKAMTNPASILNRRDITLQTKVHRVKAMVFPVVMYKCDSWTMKEASAKELMLSPCGVGKDS